MPGNISMPFKKSHIKELLSIYNEMFIISNEMFIMHM